MSARRLQVRPGIVRCSALVWEEGTWRRTAAPVVRETLLEVYLNGERRATIACGGLYPEELGVGWLRSEGLLDSRRDLESLRTDSDAGAVYVRSGPANLAAPVPAGETVVAAGGTRTPGGGRNRRSPMPLSAAREKISPDRIFTLLDELTSAASLHRLSRGTHSAALADAAGLLAVREDIGRHNCLDMLSGYCLLNDLAGGDKLLLRTGRVSSEIVAKIWRMGVPVAASLSVPTDLAVRIARRAGITLVGAVRRPVLTVYTHPDRIGEI